MQLLELGLGVKSIHMRRPTGHVTKNHVLCAWFKVRLFGCAPKGWGCQQSLQSHQPEAGGALREHFASRKKAGSLHCR